MDQQKWRVLTSDRGSASEWVLRTDEEGLRRAYTSESALSTCKPGEHQLIPTWESTEKSPFSLISALAIVLDVDGKGLACYVGKRERLVSLEGGMEIKKCKVLLFSTKFQDAFQIQTRKARKALSILNQIWNLIIWWEEIVSLLNWECMLRFLQVTNHWFFFGGGAGRVGVSQVSIQGQEKNLLSVVI